MMLDVYDMCTPELQEKLLPMRTRFKEKEDKLTELKASVGFHLLKYNFSS